MAAQPYETSSRAVWVPETLWVPSEVALAARVPLPPKAGRYPPRALRVGSWAPEVDRLASLSPGPLWKDILPAVEVENQNVSPLAVGN